MKSKIVQIIGLCLGLCQGIYSATNEPTNLADCPGVILCTSGDNSKRTLTAYEEDQRAYQCYSKFGDTQMRKIAGQAMTSCQTMYGSINPTIRKN